MDEGCLAGLSARTSRFSPNILNINLSAPPLNCRGSLPVGGGGGWESFHAGFTFQALEGFPPDQKSQEKDLRGFTAEEVRGEYSKRMEWEVFLIIEEENVKNSFGLRKKATRKK
jgi:hypothetical protein